MGIKNFKEFTSAHLNERYNDGEFHSYGGKTKFSRFLRNIKGRIDRSEAFGRNADSGLPSSRYKTLVDPIGLIARVFGGAMGKIAGVSDYLFTPNRYDKKDKKYKPVTDSEWDDWYNKKVSDKEMNDEDVEKFYASGVVSGKNMFGKGFDPAKPRNSDEEYFMKDLDDATYRLYTKRSKRK